jgi:outer membrane protein TolC
MPHRRKSFLLIVLFLCIVCAQAYAEETLTWQDCIKEAQKNHPDLISAKENIQESEATKSITASGLFPQLDSSASVSTAKTTATTSGARSTKSANTYSYGVSGTQLLFDGSKTRDNVRAASENVKAAQYTYQFTSSEVRLRLRSAFIGVLKAQGLLAITEEIRTIRKDNLDLIALRYESGMEHKGAFLTAQANLHQAEFEITQAERSLELAQRQLIKEMGRTSFSPMRVQGDFAITESLLKKPDFEALAAANPSVQKLIAQKNAAYFDVKAAQADFLPTVSAQAGASRTNTFWPPRDNQLSAGLTVSFPLFEGGSRFVETKKAKAVLKQAAADERSTRDAAVVALVEAWMALKNAVESVQVDNEFLDAAIERARIAEAQYSLGLIQFDNWTIIEDDLVKTKKTLLDAQANALLAQAEWVQAKGETLEHAE